MNKKDENRKLNKQAVIAIIMAVSLGISAFLCGCSSKNSSEKAPTPTEMLTSEPVESVTSSSEPSKSPKEDPVIIIEKEPVEYDEKIIKINDRQNHVFTLSVDLTNPDITVLPYLAFDRIFGFDYLLSMAEATGAMAAVNAGFFFEYGLPSGLVVNNGEVISSGTGKFYSLIIDDSGARFEKIKTDISITINGQKIEMESFNKSPGDSKTAIFSSAYGATDRLGYFRRAIVISDGIVTEYKKAEAAVDIPKDGYVVMLPVDFIIDKEPVGEKCIVEITPSYEEDTMAYECTTMLVKDGKSLAGDTMPWVGNLNHYDPRTCVGIQNDGRLGFVVIDGRQDGYSSGTTGRETADLLIELGFTDAVMLDGGGSSQMIYEGRTVSSPSSGPDGRPIAGGFMIILNDD